MFARAAWGIDLLPRLAPPGIPRLDAIRLHAGVVAVALGLASFLLLNFRWVAVGFRLSGLLSGGHGFED